MSMGCKDVLLIDDDEAVLESIGEILESRGFTPIFAKEGAAALKILETGPELPCLIILDMMMPGMNGWQFLEKQSAEEKYSKIPVIICSAFRETARSVRGAPILDKPVELGALMQAVHAFCA
jgi:twitching motility two-component system response regulator PilH